jgi:hypothetical protein
MCFVFTLNHAEILWNMDAMNSKVHGDRVPWGPRALKARRRWILFFFSLDNGELQSSHSFAIACKSKHLYSPNHPLTWISLTSSESPPIPSLGHYEEVLNRCVNIWETKNRCSSSPSNLCGSRIIRVIYSGSFKNLIYGYWLKV